MLRARDPEELVQFAQAFTAIALSDYQVDSSKWNNDVQITGGTPHTMALCYDPQCLRRVAAKIGYALFCTVTKRKMEVNEDERMRRYILGTETSPDEPVSIAPGLATFTTSEDPHFIVLSPEHDKTAAFVSLSGLNFRVEFGPTAVLPEPVVVICEINGSEMRIGSEAEIPGLQAWMERAEFSQPWLRREQTDETKTTT